MNRIWRFGLRTVGTTVAGLAIAALLYILWAGGQPIRKGDEHFVITPGTGVSQFARRLSDEGIIDGPYTLIAWAYLKGNTRSIRAGEYRFADGISLLDLLHHVTSGKVIRYSVTFIEGWTFKQTLQALRNAHKLEQSFHDDNSEQIMNTLGYTGQHPEGRFFPDTYFYVQGNKDMDILKRAYQRMEQRLQKEWQGRGDRLAVQTADEALILASIIEKEAADAGERPVISAVFQNRLRKHMRLQTDPSVIYGLGEQFQGNLTRQHLKTDHPYNTYTRHGLPPTPIAIPGGAALHAALHPADSAALYFVARKDGTHQFSETLEEHNKAVIKHQLGGRSRPFSSYPATSAPKQP